MSKHNALKEARQGWESFTKFTTVASVACFLIIAVVVLIITY